MLFISTHDNLIIVRNLIAVNFWTRTSMMIAPKKETAVQINHGTRVIVADSEKYLLLRNQGDTEFIDLRMVETGVRENPPTREQGSDRPGRVVLLNARRSALGNTDWHNEIKEESARELSTIISDLCANGDVSDMLVIADSKTLGRVKPKLSKPARAHIIRYLPKDLVNATIQDIETAIKAS